MLRVVLFTGGRGSSVLSARLLADPKVQVVLAINGYDDGGSTGEVRRFLGNALGPSDYRKNASRVARAKRTCSNELIGLLDWRLPETIGGDEAVALLVRLAAGDAAAFPAGPLPPLEQTAFAERLQPFLDESEAARKPFTFADCAVGNLLFAGCFLRQRREFNPAVDDYAALLGLPPGLVENVTDGANAHLVAIDADGGVLGTEEEIVSSLHVARIEDLFLIDRPLDPAESQGISAKGADEARRLLAARSVPVCLNPRLASRIDEADLIVYAPGTQHSSLYPSYLTPGLGARIARNMKAAKLLITNLESDVEIPNENAVTLVERALHYLTDRGRQPVPAPCLVTHYLLNDPGRASSDRPLVPLGQVDTFEDPRLVRIGDYEDGVSGRHDAAKVLEPFIDTRLAAVSPARVGVWLSEDASTNKIVQTLLEMARAWRPGEAQVTVFMGAPVELTREFRSGLPFTLEICRSAAEAEWALQVAVDSHEIDFVALFESSGLYRGEDLAGMFHYLSSARLAAVWGSRRLSVRDIDEAYRRRHYATLATREVSRVGSHVLSLAYLALHGRYVSDALSGVRIVRASEISCLPVALTHPALNQYLLSGLLRRRADLLEVPVQYVPSASHRVAVGIAAGLAALATICWQKIAPFAELSGYQL